MIKNYFMIMCLCWFFADASTAVAIAQGRTSQRYQTQSQLASDVRSFSVADAVEFNYLTEPYEYDDATPLVPQSPRKDIYYYATRSNNLTDNTTVSVLWFVKMPDIENYVSGRTEKLPVPAPLVTWVNRGDINNFGLMSREGIIRQFQWHSSVDYVYFIGKEDNKPDHVYRVHVNTRDVRQITDGPYPVVFYQYDEIGQRVFYYRLLPSEVGQGSRTAELVGTKDIVTVRSSHNEELRRYRAKPQLVVQAVDDPSQVKVLPFPEGAQADRYMSRIWPSPDGNLAVVSLVPPAEKRWDGRYARPESPEAEAFSAVRRHGFRYLGSISRNYQQFYLLDLSTGRWKPMFDAPSKGLGDAAWSSDGTRVVFGPTFLPSEPGEEADEARRNWQHVVEYNVQDGTYRSVYVLAGDSEKDLAGRRHGSIDVVTASEVQIMMYEGSKLRSVKVRRSAEGWELEATDQGSAGQHFDLFVCQSLNVPPKIAVRDNQSGKEVILVDLHPELQNVKYGRAEYIEWPDNNDNVWRGILVYPVDYSAGRRYPLVIQSRGVIPDEFLVGGHGGTTAPFAARPLASMGMFVLQMSPRPVTGQGEVRMDAMLELANQGVEAAIGHLEQKGLIDPEKVGLTGWSLTGLPVLHSVTFSSQKIAASVIADAYGPGMYMYASEFGFDAPGMHYMETLYRNAYPWGDGLMRWVANNPVFNLDKVRTPILLQNYSLEAELQWWEVYAILRRLGKSVEMWKYPGAEHSPRRPDQQFHAQEMVVDWYKFWLKGEKDASPRKAERYARWEEERRLQMYDLQVAGGKDAR